TSLSARFIFRSWSSNTRRCTIFSARRWTSVSSSSWPMPTSNRYPAPIEATVSPRTRTDARETRWRTIRNSAGDDAVGVEDAFHLLHRGEHRRQVGDVRELEYEPQLRDPVRADGGARRDDVHVMVGEHGRHVRQEPLAIERLHLDRYDERRRLPGSPRHLEQALGLLRERLRVRTVDPVHRHALAAGDESHDLVARHRHAAPRQTHPHVRSTRN